MIILKSFHPQSCQVVSQTLRNHDNVLSYPAILSDLDHPMTFVSVELEHQKYFACLFSYLNFVSLKSMSTPVAKSLLAITHLPLCQWIRVLTFILLNEYVENLSNSYSLIKGTSKSVSECGIQQRSIHLSLTVDWLALKRLVVLCKNNALNSPIIHSHSQKSSWSNFKVDFCLKSLSHINCGFKQYFVNV